MELNNSLPLPKPHMKGLFDFVLKENVFSFGDKIFQQVHGTAMGTKMAPSYANTFMDQLERNFLQHQPIKPLLWKRYIDDIFVIWTDSLSNLNNLLLQLNQHHPTIKFTHETSTTSVDFLDLTIHKSWQ